MEKLCDHKWNKSIYWVAHGGVQLRTKLVINSMRNPLYLLAPTLTIYGRTMQIFKNIYWCNLIKINCIVIEILLNRSSLIRPENCVKSSEWENFTALFEQMKKKNSVSYIICVALSAINHNSVTDNNMNGK